MNPQICIGVLGALAIAACGGREAGDAKSPGPLPWDRCAFGDKSYPNGERVCDEGREVECRNGGPGQQAEWHPTGASCKAGEPPAVAKTHG